MKTIQAKTIEDVCYKLISHASIHLPPEIEKTIAEAHEKETNPLAKIHFKAMLDNIEVARTRNAPLCQDTGIAMYYITVGSKVGIDGDMRAAIDRATAKATAGDVGESDADLLLRSQTSTVQIRVMETTPPPVRIISLGRVYRPDTPDDTTRASGVTPSALAFVSLMTMTAAAPR